MRKIRFEDQVRRRSQRIVGKPTSFDDRRPSAPDTVVSEVQKLTQRFFKLLPESMTRVLREAMGTSVEHEQVNKLLRQNKRKREELELREAKIERTLIQLRREQNALRELEINLRAQRPAQDASGTQKSQRRVPLNEVRYTLAEAPRPPIELMRLSLNLKRFGQQTPVLVNQIDGVLHLVSGYRRMEALKLAKFTHVDVYVIDEIDAQTKAALYIAENCFVRGVSPAEVKRLKAWTANDAVMNQQIELVLDDEELVEEEMTLDDLSEHTYFHLAEAAGWMSALRPHWHELSTEQTKSLVALIRYFANVSRRL